MPDPVIIVRPASYAWICDGESVLLCRLCEDHNAGQWTLPGGGMDPGEHPEDACRREVLEETGLTVRLTRLLCVDSVTFVGVMGPMQHLRIIYQAEAVFGELRSESDGSTDLAEWVPLTKLNSLHLVDLVAQALAGFNRGGTPLSTDSHG